MEVNTYIIFLLTTLVVEIAIAFLFKFRGKFIFTILFINLISHPFATFAASWLENYISVFASIIIIELLVIVFEFSISCLFTSLPRIVLLKFWITANVISFVVGFFAISFFNL